MLTKYQIDNYEGAGFIFHTWDWKFLMVQDIRTGKWGMCKGHRESADRHYLDTAKYEAYEELNLTEDDYEITSTPFVLTGSPKIYIFQFATLLKSVDKIDYDTEEISGIKLVPYNELLKQGGVAENNVYVRLFISHITGKFTPVRQTLPTSEPKPYVNRFSSQPMCAPKPIRVTPPETPDRSPIMVGKAAPAVVHITEFILDEVTSSFKPLGIDTELVNKTVSRPPASSFEELDELEMELATISASTIMDASGRVTPRASPSKSPRIPYQNWGGCGKSPRPSPSPTHQQLIGHHA
jgi:8-oxo-dGTP pyrophosphatase MutT (NUDIX family)